MILEESNSIDGLDSSINRIIQQIEKRVKYSPVLEKMIPINKLHLRMVRACKAWAGSLCSPQNMNNPRKQLDSYVKQENNFLIWVKMELD